MLVELPTSAVPGAAPITFLSSLKTRIAGMFELQVWDMVW